MPSFPRMCGDRKVDVLIVGGGMAGLLCAFRLHQAGVNYLLIEANRICCGTTGRTTAKITSQHGLNYHKIFRRYGLDTARVYYEANEAALGEYAKLCGELDCDFERKDGCVRHCRCGAHFRLCLLQ